jgi:phospholipid transport system substrate-binding protein
MGNDMGWLMSRRAALGVIAASFAASGGSARALDGAEAEAFVRETVDEVLAVLKQASAQEPRTEAMLDLFRKRAALPQIARFTAGVAWRSMTEAQQQAFVDAFERYAARVYSSRIGEYSGETVEVTGSQDAGRRGVLVNSIVKAQGQPDTRIDWLIDDRSGEPKLVDVVAEGVSLSISQREEFAAMLDRRGGDIDRFIADLRG